MDAALDTGQLPGRAAASLRRLLEKVGTATEAVASFPDATSYEVTVQDAERERTIAFTDANMTREQAKLVAFLQKYTKVRPPR